MLRLLAQGRPPPLLLGSTIAVPPVGAARSPSAADWRAEVEEIAQEEWVSADLIHAVMRVESRGRPQAVSAAGAIGLMQLMPATARDMSVDPWCRVTTSGVVPATCAG